MYKFIRYLQIIVIADISIFCLLSGLRIETLEIINQ